MLPALTLYQSIYDFAPRGQHSKNPCIRKGRTARSMGLRQPSIPDGGPSLEVQHVINFTEGPSRDDVDKHWKDRRVLRVRRFRLRRAEQWPSPAVAPRIKSQSSFSELRPSRRRPLICDAVLSSPDPHRHRRTQAWAAFSGREPGLVGMVTNTAALSNRQLACEVCTFPSIFLCLGNSAKSDLSPKPAKAEACLVANLHQSEEASH